MTMTTNVKRDDGLHRSSEPLIRVLERVYVSLTETITPETMNNLVRSNMKFRLSHEKLLRLQAAQKELTGKRKKVKRD